MHYLTKNYLELKLSLLGLFYKSFGLTFKYFYQICNKYGHIFQSSDFLPFQESFSFKGHSILATVNFPKNEQHHREQVVFLFSFFFFFFFSFVSNS